MDGIVRGKTKRPAKGVNLACLTRTWCREKMHCVDVDGIFCLVCQGSGMWAQRDNER